ncbi:MAG: TIM barrel protein [Fibrobacterota bacterium]
MSNDGLARYKPHFRSLQQAFDSAHHFFHWLSTYSRSLDIRTFAETQLPNNARDDELIRPGDTYESVLNLVENTNVEICWDAGHSWRSSLLKKQPPFPAADFLRKVGHVHLHDADGDERGWFDDHRPLDEGRSPWKQYLRMLFSHTYDSPFMLEVTIDSHFCDYEKKR